MNIIKERRKTKTVCPSCKNPNYNYDGRVGDGHDGEFWEEPGKLCFSCPQCHHHWQDGKSEDSLYYRLR